MPAAQPGGRAVAREIEELVERLQAPDASAARQNPCVGRDTGNAPQFCTQEKRRCSTQPRCRPRRWRSGCRHARARRLAHRSSLLSRFGASGRWPSLGRATSRGPQRKTQRGTKTATATAKSSKRVFESGNARAWKRRHAGKDLTLRPARPDRRRTGCDRRRRRPAGCSPGAGRRDARASQACAARAASHCGR